MKESELLRKEGLFFLVDYYYVFSWRLRDYLPDLDERGKCRIR